MLLRPPLLALGLILPVELWLMALPPVDAAAVPPAPPIEPAPLLVFLALPPVVAVAVPPETPTELAPLLVALLPLLADGLLAPVVVLDEGVLLVLVWVNVAVVAPLPAVPPPPVAATVPPLPVAVQVAVPVPPVVMPPIVV